MITIKNKSLDFTILYLPNRTIRLKGKQEQKITKKEFESAQFQRRREEFRIIDKVRTETVKEEIKVGTKEKPKKRVTKQKTKTDKETGIIEDKTNIIDVESEPDKEEGSL